MKINLKNYDLSEFIVRDCIISSVNCKLIFPQHIGVKWNKDNLIFRSSIWTEDGELVSASFKKFFNWGEQPDLACVPDDLSVCSLMEKIDGSTVILSYFKGSLIVRTRGSYNLFESAENCNEIEELFIKYPKIIPYIKEYANKDNTTEFSLIFEWTSPTNKIIIDYGDLPEIYLIARINHKDYSLSTQENLDYVADDLNINRPKIFQFNTIPEMISTIEALKGQEGICIYCNNGQDIRKLKSLEYLAKHRFKSEANIETILDLYLSQNEPDFKTFTDNLIKTFDYECYDMVKGFVSNIFDAKKELNKIMDHMISFINPLKSIIRKDAALKIINAYGQTNRSGFCFKLLDGKELNKEDKKKLYFQLLKGN